MKLGLSVHRPLYAREGTGAHYIDFVCRDNPVVERLENSARRTDGKPHYPSLVNEVLTVKVPWRYGRPMVKTKGIVTLYDLEPGDYIMFEASFIEKWETDWGCGTSWKMTSIY